MKNKSRLILSRSVKQYIVKKKKKTAKKTSVSSSVGNTKIPPGDSLHPRFHPTKKRRSTSTDVRENSCEKKKREKLVHRRIHGVSRRLISLGRGIDPATSLFRNARRSSRRGNMAGIRSRDTDEAAAPRAHVLRERFVRLNLKIANTPPPCGRADARSIPRYPISLRASRISRRDIISRSVSRVRAPGADLDPLDDTVVDDDDDDVVRKLRTSR